MARDYRAAVDQGTGQFVYGGWAPYDVEPGLSPGQIRVVLDREPDTRRERYSGDPLNPFRAATTQEQTDHVTATTDREAGRAIDSRELKAVLGVAIWFALGHQPTPQELQTAKTRYIALYKALG